jgi:hypothetical protein
MVCRTCGIEIADKALICYRCGTATTEAKYRPAEIRPKRRFKPSTLVALLLLILVLTAIALYWSMGG